MNKLLKIGKIEISILDKREAIKTIERLALAASGGRIFTPNVDHIMLAEKNDRFAQAYKRATLSLADGMPIVWISKLFGKELSERVAGSDMLVPILEVANTHYLNVYLLGTELQVLRIAADKIHKTFPNINLVGISSPFITNDVGDDEVAEIMGPIRHLNPDIIITAFGAPKQELFIDKASWYCPRALMFGLGASLDFFAGKIRRAPKWVQNMGLEWLWRLVGEPKRLWKRYLRDLQFPLIVYRQLKESLK